MKSIVYLVFMLSSLISLAQTESYDIKSTKDEGIKAPNTHHVGDAWLNFLTEADDKFQYNITQATFNANATLDWHKHSSPQVIVVLEGEGYYQEKGKEPVLMKVGDVIKCTENTEHWHTSSKEQKVSYLAIYSSDPTIWTEKLTQAYYDEIAKSLKDK